MKYAEYPLFAEGYINRFFKTGIFTKEQRFNKAVLSGKVNEWLKRGFAIHENPCRKEFVKARRNQTITYRDLSKVGMGETVTEFSQKQKLSLYFPFGNIGVEESGFYYKPTFLRSYYYTVIRAEKAGQVDFELSTCGGMTLWVNDELVTDFTPFTRNMEKSVQVSVALRAGDNKFIVCLDDLAERDTDYYFRLRRIGGARMSILLPLEEEVSVSELKRMEAMLEHIYFEREAYISEEVRLFIRNECGRSLECGVDIIPGEFIEKMENQQELLIHRSYSLQPDQKSIELLHSDEIRPGYYYFQVSLQTGGITLKRKIGNQLVRADYLKCQEEGAAERKQRAMDTVIADGVDNVYKAAVLFCTGKDERRAEAIILGELDGIRQRKDCSDFHFIIVLYIYQVFQERISSTLKAEIEEVMLHYRYWIDEPGDDVMWFFSENHALLFHICQYLAGKYLPDQVFTNSGLTGLELHQKAEGLLLEWFESFFSEFITEWNSTAYIPVDVLGIGTLYNLTDAEHPFHQKAKQALDMIFYSLCVNAHKGAVMTSFGRTYEKELKGNYNAGTTGLLYAACQAGYVTRGAIGYLAVILGDYEAPSEYRRYLQLRGDRELVFQNTQGYEQHVNLYLYKNAETVLSTAVGFAPGKKGYQEHILEAAIDELAQVFINHPGESHPYGSGRPNFWAGNGILPMAMQYRETAVLRFEIGDEHRIDYTHAYIPLAEFHQYCGDSHTIVLEKDGGYIGVKALNGLKMQAEGPCRHREFISPGRRNVWVVRVAGKGVYQNPEAFLKVFKWVDISLKEDGEVLVTAPEGREYRIDQKNECFVNGEKIYHYPLPVEGIIEEKGEQADAKCQ